MHVGESTLAAGRTQETSYHRTSGRTRHYWVQIPAVAGLLAELRDEQFGGARGVVGREGRGWFLQVQGFTLCVPSPLW